MRDMAVQNHLKSRNTEVPQFAVVKNKIVVVQLDDIHRVVQHHRVGCLDIPDRGDRVSAFVAFVADQ